MNTDEHGYLDALTERALLRELALCGIRATAQASLVVTYKGQFPKIQSRMEAHHLRVSGPRAD